MLPNPNESPGSRLPFPDLSRVTIERLVLPTEKGSAVRTSVVDVATLLNSSDCAKAPWLEWGDIVDIPELDHPVNAPWFGLAQPVPEALAACLKRGVGITIKGQTRKVELMPIFQGPPRGGGGLPKAVVGGPAPIPVAGATADTGPRPLTLSGFRLNEVLRQSGLLRVSSDLTRVRVTRTDPVTKQPTQWIVDLSPGVPYDARTDLWLRDGDVIEVPEKE